MIVYPVRDKLVSNGIAFWVVSRYARAHMTEQVQDKKMYSDVKIETLPGSEVEITGEVTVETVSAYRQKTIQKVSKNIDIPGFRKGHVPEEMVVKHLGEEGLLKEIAERVLGDVYAHIVEENKLGVVGRPMVTITKLAPGNPIGFKIRSAVYPKIELPDYKKISSSEKKKFKDKDSLTVTDEELDKELKRLQHMMTPPAEEGGEAQKAPELNDEFAQKVGGFKDLNDLKGKMKEQMIQEKKYKEQEKERLTLAEAVIEKSKLEVPSIFIEGELDQMVASFTDRVKRAGLELDGYLKQVGKTMEDLRKEWRTDAEKRAKLQLVFNEIADKEGIRPDSERLNMEVAHVKEHYPDANEDSVRVFVSTQMINEKVFELLEGKEGGSKSTTGSEGVHVHDETCSHDH